MIHRIFIFNEVQCLYSERNFSKDLSTHTIFYLFSLLACLAQKVKQTPVLILNSSGHLYMSKFLRLLIITSFLASISLLRSSSYYLCCLFQRPHLVIFQPYLSSLCIVCHIKAYFFIDFYQLCRLHNHHLYLCC